MFINVNEEDISSDAKRLVEQLAIYFAKQEMKIDSVNRELNYVQEKFEKIGANNNVDSYM